jgi:uncharacterized protein
LIHSFGIDNVLSGVRALLAKELVKRGYPQKEISEILGTSPAAVTLYSKDRRGLQLSRIIRSDKNAQIVIDNLLQRITQRKPSAGRKAGLQKDTFPLILDAAYRIMRIVSSSSPEEIEARVQNKHPTIYSDSLTETLIDRMQEEQLAAERNMALAVGTTDEVARTIFRQIASDSIRHAEIVSFLLSVPRSDSKRNPKRKMIREEIAQIEAMIRGEESATEEPISIRGIDPALKLLLKSIDIDEEKHKILLNGLLSINKSKANH